MNNQYRNGFYARIAAGLAAMLLTAAAPVSPPPAFSGQVTPVHSASALQDADFYLLSAIEQNEDAHAALLANDALRQLGYDIAARYKRTASFCETAVAKAENDDDSAVPPEAAKCVAEPMRWTDAERKTSAEAIGRLYDTSPAFARLVREHLRPSGYFRLYEKQDDRALLVSAWSDAMQAIDHIILVYGEGEKPRYAEIDSVIYPPNGVFYRYFLANLIRDTVRTGKTNGPAYAMTLHFALELLRANRRDDAVRQYAMQEKENAAAYRRMQTMDWAQYKYASIFVPGYSPEIAYEPLNPAAKLRLKRGVELYRAGLAPVIIVSGGNLRPIGTPYTEAMEMKRYLMSEYGVPENAILIDPLARHTTTNMRNVARLLFRVHAPERKKSLVTGQVHYIASAGFRDRCQRDFGYVPYTLHAWLDFDTMEFLPVKTSTHLDASDPMDP